MAFEFGSDILVDAMRAADPGMAAEAKSKLERISGIGDAAIPAEDFRSELARVRSSNPSSRKPEDTMQKFEAAVLTTFVQAMMPKEASSVFGGGLAGDMWKAQMSEKLAEQVSKRGGIGIASRLLKDYHRVGDGIEAVPGLSDPAEALKSTRAIDGAAQFLQKVELDSLLKITSEKAETSAVLHPGGRTLS